MPPWSALLICTCTFLDQAPPFERLLLGLIEALFSTLTQYFHIPISFSQPLGPYKDKGLLLRVLQQGDKFSCLYCMSGDYSLVLCHGEWWGVGTFFFCFLTSLLQHVKISLLIVLLTIVSLTNSFTFHSFSYPQSPKVNWSGSGLFFFWYILRKSIVA